MSKEEEEITSLKESVLCAQVADMELPFMAGLVASCRHSQHPPAWNVVSALGSTMKGAFVRSSSSTFRVYRWLAGSLRRVHSSHTTDFMLLHALNDAKSCSWLVCRAPTSS